MTADKTTCLVRQLRAGNSDTASQMTSWTYENEPCPDPDDDPANPGVEDELQDLIGRAEERKSESNEDELDFSCGGKLPPDHPDADIYDDLDL